MEEAKLSPSYVHNFCPSLIKSGVCLLFDSGNTAEVSPEICQSIHDDYSYKLLLENILELHSPQVKIFLHGVRYNVSFMQKYQQCINKNVIKRSMPGGLHSSTQLIG